MASNSGLTTGQRLAAVMDHLGIEQAHFAIGSRAGDAFELIRERPGMVTSLTLLSLPSNVDIASVEPLAARIVCLRREKLMPLQQRNLETLRTWNGPTLVNWPAGYESAAWADVVHDHTGLVTETLVEQASTWAAKAVALTAQEGETEEIRYRISGSGSPLLLFPLDLAPTQWDAALIELSKHFTAVRPGGAHLGMVKELEGRATKGTYIQGVQSMFDLMQIEARDRVLEVGTGQGSLSRALAIKSEASVEIVAVDINEYLLDEARYLAGKESLSSALRYEYGDAESLPFEDETFDVAFSSTVFEECDVEEGLAELRRVLKPGGRAGVIVRSRDLPWYWNLDVSNEIHGKINVRDSSAPMSSGGCADSSIYTRFAAHFTLVRPNPFWASNSPFPPFIARERGRLNDEEARAFDEALANGGAVGVAFAGMPHHCVVGTKAG